MRIKKILLVLLLLLFAFGSLLSNAGAAGKGYYADGQLQWEYLFADGQISEARWFNEAGLLVSRALYSAGQPGKSEGYRADGSLEWQVQPLEEARQEVTLFDENGSRTDFYQTLAGKADGLYQTFYSDGQVRQEATYRQGVLSGPARTFFSSGQVEHEFTYSNGDVDGLYRTYSETGTLLSEYAFSAGQLQ